MRVVYDAGVLVAADRGDRFEAAKHRVRLEMGIAPIVTAPVVAQVSRDPRQALLRRMLVACDVAPFSDDDSHVVGELLARAKTNDVVDAHVVVTAARLGASIVTSDVDDIGRLVAHAKARLSVERV